MACPVCFGGDDTVMRESLNAGIGVLMGVTVIVLAAFARFFFVLARRAKMGSGVILHETSEKMTPDPITVFEK